MPDIQSEIRARRAGDIAEQEETLAAQERAALLRAERRQGVRILLAQGKTQEEIACALYSSERTIRRDVAYLRGLEEEAGEPIPQDGFKIPAEPDHARDDVYTDSTPKAAHRLAQKYALRDIAAQQFRRFKDRDAPG